MDILKHTNKHTNKYIKNSCNTERALLSVKIFPKTGYMRKHEYHKAGVLGKLGLAIKGNCMFQGSKVSNETTAHLISLSSDVSNSAESYIFFTATAMCPFNTPLQTSP